MTEQEAIEELKKDHYHLRKEIQYKEERGIAGTDELKEFDMAISALEKQMKSGWVKCSERLPEEYKVEILTMHEKDYMRSVKVYTTYIGEHGDRYIGENFTIDGEWVYGNVIAWKPLPEPYKAGEDNE